MRCENCESVLENPALAVSWKEYLVGGVSPSESFYFCPKCVNDDSVKPRHMLEIVEVNAF
jgi:hypothetical protein